MNRVDFILSFLDRVLAQERELRRCFAAVKSKVEWFDHIPKDVFEEDRSAAYLLHRCLWGVSRLEPSAIKRLFKEAAFGTLIVAAREQGMDADALNALLMAQGASGRSCTFQGVERIPVRQRRLSASDFPCDAYGHNPRWYAQLSTHIRHRYASDYRRLGTILKQAGCPRPVETDAEGLSVEDYARSVLPKRAAYLAIDISKGAEAAEFPVAYLDRAAGEKLAHDDDKSNVLLFRMIDGCPNRCDAYIGVFTLTCGQMAHIVGGMKRSDPLR